MPSIGDKYRIMKTAAATGDQHSHGKSQASQSIDISEEFVRVGDRTWPLGHIQEVSVYKHDASENAITAACFAAFFFIVALISLNASLAFAVLFLACGVFSVVTAYLLYDGPKDAVAIMVGGHTSEVFSDRDPQEAGQIKERIERAIAMSTPQLDN